MKTGRTLQELAAELDRQKDARRDFIAPQGVMEAVVEGADVRLAKVAAEPLAINGYAHGQLGDQLGIPRKYYEKMRTEQPALLAANLNAWMRADAENKRMVRTLDGRVRAVLSPKYRPLDNYDLAQTVLPTLMARKAQILSCELTETRMYLKAILPDLSDPLPQGLAYGQGHNRIDGRLAAAITIANSDIGAGTLRVEPSVFTTSCTNLLVLAEAAMRKYHVGRAFEADASFEVFRDETRRADDRAFWLKVKDVTEAAFDEQIFRAAVASIRESAEKPITSKALPEVVEVAVSRLSLPPSTSGSILTHLAAGGDLSQWGLASAITRTAEDLDDYELATEFERAGGKVLALPATDWQAIATAA